MTNEQIEELKAAAKHLCRNSGDYAYLEGSDISHDIQYVCEGVATMAARLADLERALQQFAECDLHEGNCASLEVATAADFEPVAAALEKRTPKT